MSKLERVLAEINSLQSGESTASLTPVCMLVITLAYLLAMLSVPPQALTMLIWFAIFPIVAAPLTGTYYSHILLRSLIVVPLAALIGMFNPIFDTEAAFHVGGVEVSRGWVSFVSIILRAVLSMQALLILIRSTGFNGVCRSLRRVGMPEFLTVQLMMVYRYLTVLIQEALDMRRAREARGYGKKNMPLRMWGAFAGQLFLRTINRADSIHRAMLSRGFTGTIPLPQDVRTKWRTRDTLALLLSVSLFTFFRFTDISALFGFR